MLINQITGHVEFIEYTGKWPNLCAGILTLKINGEIQKFGNDYFSKEPMHPRFWIPGGLCSIKNLETDEWQIDVLKLPEQFRIYAAEIDNIFNDHVEYGHCGGCR